MKNICVFCSASDGIDEIYHKDAEKMGELLAKNNFDIIYGGSSFGLMGKLSQTAQKFGADVTGVMPEKIYKLITHDGYCNNFVLTEGMRERKAKFDELSDGLITLAGGFGTLEEVSEMIVQKILGYNTKPIVFLNTNNFFNKLFDFFNHIIEENFALKNTLELYYIAQTPEEVIQYLKNYVPNVKPETIEEIYVKAK